jgi:hypothetical protein
LASRHTRYLSSRSAGAQGTWRLAAAFPAAAAPWPRLVGHRTYFGQNAPPTDSVRKVGPYRWVSHGTTWDPPRDWPQG